MVPFILKKLRSDLNSGGGQSSSFSTQLSDATSSSKSQGHYNLSKTVILWRVTFVVFLLAVAGALGYLGWFFVTKAEDETVNELYKSMVDRALLESKRIAENKLHGTATMAKVVGYASPDADTWPNVAVRGYYEIAASVVPTSIVGGMSFAPLVMPGEEQASFEKMAYEHYAQVFPNTTAGVSSFGKGIWVKHSSIDTPDNRYHDTTGETNWGSKYQFLAPKFQHSRGNHKLLMMNVHGFMQQGQSVDATYECSVIRAKIASSHPNDDHPMMRCVSISDMVPPKDPTNPKGPGAFVSTAIYPANNKTVLTGFIFAKMNWNEVLDNVFPAHVNGIDCVIKTYYSVHTYEVVNGTGIYKGEGDKHDINYEESLVWDQLLDPETMSQNSVPYTILFYRNEKFGKQFRTQSPLIATIGAVAIIIFTSSLFFLYDHFVRREVMEKKDLLEAKRQFVRFVSHEVRTPLNSVCMGLMLLQEEVAAEALTKKKDEESEKKVLKESNNNNNKVDEHKVEEVENELVDGDKKDEDESNMNGQKEAQHETSGTASGAGWVELAQEVQTNAQSAVDVLNDLLNYDKIESGTLMLELTVVRIWELIESTVREFALPAATKKVALDLVLPRDNDDEESPLVLCKEALDQKVVGDAVRITQVLRNLVSNALKFTPEGNKIVVTAKWLKADSTTTSSNSRRNNNKKNKQEGLERSFQLKNNQLVSASASGHVEVTVKDTGAGMTRDQLSRLFGQGVQFNVNELQAGSGSGLGLYIAKGIVEQHEGSLVASSEGLGKGTCFSMRVPLFCIPETTEHASSDDGAGSSSNNRSRSSSGSSSGSREDEGLRVLVVDDSSSNRKLLCRLLTNRGHRCDECENGRIAVDTIKESIARDSSRPYYDLVLLDYEMPVMNGPMAAKEIRESGCDVCVVGITGNMMAEDVKFFTSCGATVVLPKPFKMTALDEVIVEYNIGRAR